MKTTKHYLPVVRNRIPLLLSAGIILFMAHGSRVRADLTDGESPNEAGELNGQNGWMAQKSDGDSWGPAWEAVVVEQGNNGNNVITWQPGNGERDQVRVLREFPATNSEKVLVKFSFKPGDETLGGRLYFGQTVEVGVVALQFLHGRVWVLESGQDQATDSGVAFSPEEWNTFEIHLDFTKAKAEVRVNGTFAGRYEIPPKSTALGFVNLFGGGKTHGSSLTGLEIAGVSNFTDKTK